MSILTRQTFIVYLLSMKKLHFFFLFLLFGVANTKAQFITIDDQRTATELVSGVLVNSPCALISTANADGENSYASFNANGTNFPFSEGIVLSTNSASNSVGPFIPNNRGGGSDAWGGDDDLDAALGINSINATVLEFDFIPLTNSISFNYLFASNEYQSYFPCQFSDGFAFLIKEAGSTDTYKNLAVLPNSSTIVSSTNVHPQINNVQTNQGLMRGCPPINEQYFNGYNSPNNATNYAGQTVVLNASTDVIAGRTYHIKLVVADDQEEYFDSAVFIEGGSFVPTINLGQDYSLSTNNPACAGETILLNTQLAPSNNYKWYKNGSLITGANDPFYNVQTTGTYKVIVEIGSGGCEASDEIFVEFAAPIVTNNMVLTQCDTDNDGFSIFNLNKIATQVKQNDTAISTVQFYENQSDAMANSNAIAIPTEYKNTSLNQILYYRAENQYDCFEIKELQLVISNNPIVNQSPIITCDSDSKQDGITAFDLNSQITPQLLNGLPSNIQVAYYISENDAVVEINPLPNNFTNTIAYNQTLFARLLNGSDCFNITPIDLIINKFDPPNFQEETKYICNNTSVNLMVTSGFVSYLWSTSETTENITVTVPGNYTVTVTDVNNCYKTKTFVVKESEVATITKINTKDFNGTSNSATIKVSGNGDYEFSLDGSNFQNENTFNNLEPNAYTASIRDKNGCGTTTSSPFYILDYPRYFTPNGDNFNDVWLIENDLYLPDYVISIFDRYGKLLKQLPKNNSGWTGLYNGKQLPADDYWFILDMKDGRLIKGHFSLKR